ncbi:MAG: DUF115 domain-containing protein [Lachnospiraceae bacterium]|nr:DUF115 domain-containing protein [Lachnospiraceae bacterium]
MIGTKKIKKVEKFVGRKINERPILKKFFQPIIAIKKKLKYIIFFKYKYEVNDKLVLFESFHGAYYNCNPRGIYEEMLRDDRYMDYKFVWAFKEPDKYKFLENNFRTVVVKSNSKQYYKYCASAKYVITNFVLMLWITLKKEQVYIQTWHGKPIKRIGYGMLFDTNIRKSLNEYRRQYAAEGKKITKLLSPCAFFSPIMGEAFHFPELRKNDIIETGYPRNDALFRYTEERVSCIKRELGIKPDKKVILYAPTWRSQLSEYLEKEHLDISLEVSNSINFTKLKEQLGEEYVILFRAHHMDAKKVDVSAYEDFIIDVTDYENVNDLYIISNLMISDYSGTIFDFALLRRPMIFYMFDRELYVKMQGVYINFNELPGIIIEKEEDLVSAIRKQFAEFVCDEKYEDFLQKYCLCDDGRAGQRVIEKCIQDTVMPKTITLQGVKKYVAKYALFLKKIKWNSIGVLREAGIIRDLNSRKLLAMKNKYSGQRCFLVANGPSLKSSDLDMIADEISFGCNMIYKMFEQTKWRPTYHFIVDVVYTKNLYQEIEQYVESPMIMHDKAYRSMRVKPQDVVYVHSYSQEDYQIRGNMLAYYIPAKATVMTFMIEMAIYMGFNEIYLLGVDNTNVFTAGHFSEKYTPSELDKVNLARARESMNNSKLTLEELGEYRVGRAIKAYEKISEYTKRKGVRIYNVTRGGALEVFPRKSIEDVLSDGEK